ncbi:hypothetical protein [Paenibacillus sp. RC84]|uniref:phage neck terminator protein n=1 Tax=Paenibacillus sp. RC84 TaxID=3156252 RepID=UPI0035154E81
MIQFKAIRNAIVRGLAAHLGVKVIEMNGGGDIPKTAFLTYDFSGSFGDRPGYPAVYVADDKIREVETVPFTVSFLSYADDKATSMENALKAREWFRGAGRELLKESVNAVVYEIGEVQNRDIAIGSEWERRQGFDVEFRTQDIVETPLVPIDKVTITRS